MGLLDGDPHRFDPLRMKEPSVVTQNPFCLTRCHNLLASHVRLHAAYIPSVRLTRGAHIDMKVSSDSGPSFAVAQRTLHAGELTLGSLVSNGRVLHPYPAELTQRAYCAEPAIRDHSSSPSGNRAPDSRIDHTWEPETGIRSKHMTSICERGVRTSQA